ncbi:MAG: hypothetical protein AAFX81_11485 [Pseudomonadota bacterium]
MLTFRVLLAVVSGSLVVASQAHADSFAFGDPLRLAPSEASSPDDDLSVSFTPRLSGVFSLDSAKLSVSMKPVGDVSPVDVGLADPTTGFDRSRFDHGEVRGFALGGALTLEGVAVSGALLQSEGQGYAEDGFSASVAAGGLTTGLRISEIDSSLTGSENRYSFGAELEAAPGLSFGAGVQLRDRDRADDATGSVRLRLSF